MKSHRAQMALKPAGFLLMLVLYFWLGTKDLYIDVINPDGINWHNRTNAFVTALKEGKYSDTFQVYHPGITLMWISGPVLNLFHNNQISDVTSDEAKTTFLERDYYAKLSLVIFSLVIFAITFVVLWKLVNYKFAFIFSIFFIFEPFVLGMRRLYHLDYLMTTLVFLGFTLVVYFSYKSQKWFLLPLAGLCFALAVLTKSSAVMVLCAVPFIFFLGDAAWYKKLTALFVFIISTVLFLYAFFPPVWKDPVKSFPGYYKKIAFGVSDIGIAGKREIGTSGKGESTVLEKTLKDKGNLFYLSSLFVRLSLAGSALLIITISIGFYFFSKELFLFISRIIKNKKIPKEYKFPPGVWLSFWSFCLSVAIMIALTLAVKKSDRYIVLIFPFLFVLISYFLSNIDKKLSVVFAVVYLAVVGYELKEIHPYYAAYSNPYFGGLETRLNVFDNAPFGIGIYEAFQIVKKDMESNDYNGYYTISGPKSIKAISEGGRFSLYPSCVTDYSVVFGLEDQPTDRCAQKYEKIGSVNISGFDYWNVYKRLSQKHESNHYSE